MQLRWRTGPYLVAALGAFLAVGGSAYADCVTPANAIEAENCLPGNPATEWDVVGSGDATIQGFATDMSVNRGTTVEFKVVTDATSYRIDIYRIGYYGGNGARKVATVLPSVTLPQTQPACLTDSTGLVDCGNWAVSASWPVPANAVSGIYIARLVRNDTTGASHVVFIVRHDGGNSALLFQTADTTWQAYNRYGGNSLYQGTGPGGGLSGGGRAYKVSYNRPMTAREYSEEDYLFNAEYPMVRWLEQNGYDVSYFSGVDTDRLGPEIARHKVFVSVGHDEYWSKQQRLNVEGARDVQFPGQTAPVHLAFFSGNDVFWKTRWEPSISSPATAHRTLVCYKETHEGANIDPSPEWTGTWRDARPINTEGPNPENALTGTIFTVGCCTYPLEMRAPEAQMRFWRNTPNVSLLTGAQVWPGPSEAIGYEWNEDLDNGVRPAGLVRLSATTRNVPERILDFGSTYGPGTATHSLVFHKRPSGALVFSAGTIQWSWGLDSNHARGNASPSPDMQQATVNLFADMGAQPATLDPLLVPASASTDVVAATSLITAPANNVNVPVSVPVTIQGTASDAAPGRVGGVEVSVDGGLTWHPATGRGPWSYVWTPTQNGTYTIRSRAVDDSGNLEIPGAGITVFVGPPPPPPGGTSIWGGAGTPALTNQNDGQAIGLGVKFRSSVPGQITAIRFYKGDQDTGVHVGRLWTVAGGVLGTVTFTGETASGWQEALLPSPVAIAANTTYVATYHSSLGYYSVTDSYFTASVVNGFLTALADGTDGFNGLYRYSPTAFPNVGYQSSNYWVDVVFVSDVTPPTVTGVTPPSGASGVVANTNVSATFDEAIAPSTVNGTNFQLRDAAAQLVAATVTWDPATRTALLDPTANLAFLTTYTATVRGGPGGVTDVQGNPVNGDVTWTFTVEAEPPPDTTPPTIAATAPPNGASNVGVATSVTATFNEALAPATVNGASFELRDALGQLVAATVGWNPATLSAVLDPTGALAFSSNYTATVRGGTGGVTDVAGNPLASDFTWTFTTQPDIADVSLWSGPVSPTVPNANDNQPIEVGVKFRASIPGYVTALRFYKGSQDTGTHVGSLWSSNGTRLATASFVGETASGWQQVTLSPAVAIAANTTYIASKHSAGGSYAATPGYFTDAWVNGPLTALADGTDGGNGLYRYGASAFPNQSSARANYWVDIVFNSQAPPPDTTPPTVIATTPANGATGVLADSNLLAQFSESLSPATVNASTMLLQDLGGRPVSAAVTWIPSTNSAVLDPAVTLAYSATYTVIVKGGPSGVADNVGNTLASDFTWTFTTEPPPEEGPGGPILVIGHAGNLFSRYGVEILRAEGLNAFKSLDITVLNAAVLSTYDVAILGEMPLTPTQVTMLSDWVNAGGNLIALRPDVQLAGLLGLTPAAGTLADAYLQVDTASAPGQGIVGQTIQFHGTADRYTLAQATAVATLFSNATTATTHPAVSLRSVGLGNAAAFTFDLARSVVYTRQGNPAWVGDERDGIAPIRSDDLFYGAKVGDVRPDWVDLNKVAIPQADEQMRLLANLILHMNRDRKPLPRFWYFPFGKKAVVVMTSDNHAHGPLGESRLDWQRSQDPPGCDVTRWECIRSSMYLYNSPFNGAATYQAQGFEIGLHVNTNCADWTNTSVESFFSLQLGEFATLPQFAGIAPPTTNRTHCITWSDWATHARTELAHGMRLDTNYYYWPETWVQNRPGHFTGSGMPMRFADLDGARIDVYQATTQITDESGQEQPFTIDTLLDRALGTEGYYAAVTANIHSDNGDNTESDVIVLSAQARGVPVVSARQMLTWLDGRNGSSFQAISWSNDVLTFGVAVGAGAIGIEAMLPMRAAGATKVLATLTRDAIPLSYSTQTVKGVEYAVFAGDPGTYQAAYTRDVTPPVISAVSASVPGTNGAAIVQWLTDENSTSVLRYGTDPGSLTQTVSASLLVTSHNLVTPGLSANTTYYYQVMSVDPAGNSANSPVSSFQVGFVDTVPPVVTLVRPTGGERVFAGTPYVLQWTATDNDGVTAVDVAFSSNAGSTFTAIAECTGLAGTAQTCTWAAPTITTLGRIRVTARDAANLSGSATSGANFTVVAGTASLTLTAPVTAVSWRIGNTQNITFSHNFGTGQLVAVDVSRDAGATWTTVNPAFVTTNGTSGSVPWVVSGPATGTARARVTWSGNPAITSASPVNFIIIDRISVTAPNTAVTWTIASARSITWSHNLGAGTTVNIDVSRDGGTTWSPIAAGIANAATTGTFSWVVTGPATTTARIRVSSVADPTIASVSAVNFIVSGTITVTDPTGTSVWGIGSTRTVTWNHNLGAGQTFDLDLSTDNGVTYPTSIAIAVAGAPANGAYTWVVPGPVTAIARIRVRWSSSTAVAATTGAFDMVNPVVTVTSPNTAVIWGIGATRSITWNHNLGTAGQFNIDLSTDGGLTYPTSVATSVPANATNGTYAWAVSGPVSTTSRIRVSWVENALVTDASNVNFTMANPVITVTSPNTAVNWPIGQTRAITWNQNLGNLETVDIDRSDDGGVSWTPIATNVPNAATNGTFNWVVSDPPSTTTRIRVSWAANPSVTDLSNVNFTVGNPFITVTAPNTAVTWAVGSTQNITFNHNLGIGVLINVEVSRDGGATFSLARTYTTTSAPADTVPAWVVTGPATTQARIRLSSGAVSDMSDVDFTIQWTITLTSPNTAVTWGIGASRAITWNHNLGAGQLFNIDLSTDGGVTYPTSVATSVPGNATNGTFTWTVSGPASTTTRIRVSSAADASITGQSAVNFTMADPVITLTAPNTAVSWPIGQTRAITWNQNLGNAETVNIDRSTDGGLSWSSIANNVPNAATNGTYTWTVSSPASTTNRIRVSWAANASVSGQSAVDFTVGDPFVTVTSPNTAVTWAVASTQNVTFNHNLGTGVLVSVDVSRDGGATFSPVTTFTTTVATTGSVPWVVTGPATTQARMRVSWAGGATDTSDVDFTVQ